MTCWASTPARRPRSSGPASNRWPARSSAPEPPWPSTGRRASAKRRRPRTPPPLPLEYQGRELATRFFILAFRTGRRFRLVATRADGQPAFGVYERDRHSPVLHANGLLVLTLAADRGSMITRFDTSVLPRFGLPRSLPG